MPVPKRKRSRARRDKRFANKGMELKPFTACSNCETPLTPHQACKGCGFYKGAKVLQTKIDRSLKRAELKKAQHAKRAEAPAEQESE